MHLSESLDNARADVALQTPNLHPRGMLAEHPALRTPFEAKRDRLDRLSRSGQRPSSREDCNNESSNLT